MKKFIVSAVAIAIVALIIAFFLTRKPSATGDVAEAVKLNNRGIGQMEQFEYLPAVETFEKAVQSAPDWRPAQVNLGLALLNTADPANLDRAVKLFEKLIAKDANDAHAHYSLGMILLYRNQPAEAYPHFTAVTKIDPNDAHGWYHRGVTHPDGREVAEAKEFFQKALKLNPYFNAARYAVAMHPHDRNDDASAALLAEMEKLVKANWEQEYAIKYSEMGRYAEVVGRDEKKRAAVKSGPLPLFNTEPAMKIALAPNTKWATKEDRNAIPQATGGAMLLFDFDGDDKPDVLLLAAVVENGQLRDLLLHNDGGGAFRDITKASGILASPSVSGCVGDFDNDGKPDLFLAGIGQQRLLRNSGGKFEDVTKPAGWEAKTPTAIGCLWVDLDQDGDLDLVTAAGDAGVIAWLNVGEAPPAVGDVAPPLSVKFQKFDGLPKELHGQPTSHIVVTDLDGDRDLDLVVLSGNRARPIFNDRLLRFHVGPDLPAPAQMWTAGLILDVEADERSEMLLIGGGNATLLNRVDGSWKATTPALPTVRQAVMCDFDLDDHADVFALNSEGKTVLLHNDGGKLTARTDVLGTPGSEPAGLIATAVVDLDGDCSPDVLLWAEGTGLTWRKNMGNGNRAVRVSLTGRRDKGSNLRTNSDGIGAWVSALAGTRQPMMENSTLAAGPGQSRLPLMLGIGPATQAEVVRIRWPDGVPQAELNVPTCEKFTVVELNRKGTSCPVLLTWDGTKFVFVTDLLGGGALGEMGPDGSFRVPRPEESVAIDRHMMQPKDGRYLMKLAEPMDEVMYLDRVRLAVVDHPAGMRILPDERFATEGAAPTQQLLAFRQWFHPKSAKDDAGCDVTELVTKRDGRTVAGFRPRSWLGYAEEHFVELDFGDTVQQIGKDQRLFLALAGWTDYPYPESIYAANQAGIAMVAPTLEQKTSTGKWEKIAEIGFPAGLPKWMTFEVTGKLKPGPMRIRSNLQIYWDEIALAPLDNSEIRVRWLDASSATLAHRGFMREVPSSDRRGPVSYDDDRTEPVAVTKWGGRLTRTGDVTELLNATDDCHVLCGPGDEVTMSFDAVTAEPPSGWQRSFVLRTWGYCKDTAPFTATGGQVGPLPFRAMSKYPYGAEEKLPASILEYDRRWNTRRIGAD